MKLSGWLFIVFCFSMYSVEAQYDPSKIFVTNRFYTHSNSEVRSASGKPGSEYWQNRADYEIKADFDVKTRRLAGIVLINYTNNSPDELDALWLQLDQNTSNPDARISQIRNPNNVSDDSKGYKIEKVTLSRNGKTQKIPYQIDGTRMQIRLRQGVKSGEKIKLTIDYKYILQAKGGGGRSGYMNNENGKIFEFSYWYPRMSVYDDYYGWNTLPFIGGGEMYLDYGTIDYKVTVPADEVVVGSGVLQNQKKILNKRTLKRLKKASHSDQTVMIRRANELNQPVTKQENGKVTWHFKMENTRDVAWAMSTDYIWDAAKVNLSNGKEVLAQSVYPKALTEQKRGWSRSTEMLKSSVEFFSDFLMDYPYQVATSVAGSVGGMEYPGLAFNYWDVKDDVMFLLVSHEIGHTWFPMLIGSDERRNPFMDEGLNVFMDIYAQAAFNKGEFAPKRDGEYAPNGGNPSDEIIEVIESAKNGPTIMTAADNMPYKFVHPLDYFKAAHGLVLLREVILGHHKFDYAFKQYAKNWSYKHPRPEDFFRSMDNGSGEDLSWFWQGWFYHNWQLDQAVEKVEYLEENPSKGVNISVLNKQQMVMPILITVEEENGKIHQLKVPVAIWKYGEEAKFKVNTSSKIKYIELDKKHQLPDIDRSNNVWKG